MMNKERHPGHRALLLWLAFGLPAAAWMIQLTASYMLAAYACANDQMWILHAISIAALVLAAAGLVCGWKAWRVRPGQDKAGGENRFMVAGVLLLAVLLFLAIVAGELSNWLLEPCV